MQDEQYMELLKQITRTEERAKSNTKRIDGIDEDRKELSASMIRMATAIEILANEQKHSSEALTENKSKLDEVDTKISNLELAPAISAKRLRDEIIKVVTTGIVGTILGAILTLVLK